MDTAYVTALSALSGSAIGALASFATTWLTQNYQDRTQKKSQAAARRERLYGEFIEKASKSFDDALTNTLSDTKEMVDLYATRSKIRLFAPDPVTRAADSCIRSILETYLAPNRVIGDLKSYEGVDLDFLREFTERCRDDLAD